MVSAPAEQAAALGHQGEAAAHDALGLAAGDVAVLEDDTDSLVAIGCKFGKTGDLHLFIYLILHRGH